MKNILFVLIVIGAVLSLMVIGCSSSESSAADQSPNETGPSSSDLIHPPSSAIAVVVSEARPSVVAVNTEIVGFNIFSSYRTNSPS